MQRTTTKIPLNKTVCQIIEIHGLTAVVLRTSHPMMRF